MTTALPIDQILPQLKETLRSRHHAVVQAEPGAGKTTRIPLALLEEPWLAGQRIIMLEPRRLAARSAAWFMSTELGSEVGERIGYRVRLDSRVSARTRIEIVTEGVLTRMLQEDPALTGVGLVIFDEFHERSLQADLALALCLETQQALREELRLLVMSATLDGAAVAQLLGDAPIISSTGRSHPVETVYAPPLRPAEGLTVLQHVVTIIKRALNEQPGSLLVFLPGVGEIKRVEALLMEAGIGPQVSVCPLYSDLALDAQEQAIRPAPDGRRKIVLATSIAETSLTIEGVRVVIDSGAARVPRFDPSSGLTRLMTVAASQAAAEQRRGRAGRLEPGVCYRLWSAESHRQRPDFERPEILDADLAPLALDLAQWGVADPATLAWLDPPPAAHYAQACDLLQHLGALDARRTITSHGKKMAQLAMHPRLSHMILRGLELGWGALACDLAAVLGERDLIKGPRDADLAVRLDVLQGRGAPPGTDRGAVTRARKNADTWRRQLGIKPDGGGKKSFSPLPLAGEGERERARPGILLAFAYPDRIAQRRPGSEPRYLLANGRGALFTQHEALCNEDYIVAAYLDGNAREARIFLAAALDRSALDEYFAEQITELDIIEWDARNELVQARGQQRLDALVLSDKPLEKADVKKIAHAMLEGIRALGLVCLPWTDGLRTWQRRVMLLQRLEPAVWPDVSDAALLATLEDWLAPYLNGVTRRSHLANIDLHSALTGRLAWDKQKMLDEQAPTHLTVPSGSRVAIDYDNDPPVLAVRLQEMFGLADTPRIAGGRVALLLHLLSPARRPVQVTQDLAGFWARSYHDVKKDLKGRYPKHYWPDDPLQAEPTARAKPRS